MVTDRPDSKRDSGTLIGRRSLLMMLLAAGVVAPLVGSRRAQAAAEDPPYEVPEESGALGLWLP